tara:strand:- start:164 stop:754 length:591 start_codon:yes stop_codon:yes gene_type:complete
MKIIKTSLPNNSVLNTSQKNYDFSDSFESVFKDSQNTINITEIGKAFFTSGPKWVDNLFSLRNKIVSVFGLKTPGKVTNRAKQLELFKCNPGEQLGLFKVFSKNENEVILGEDDKHLNFRISIFVNQSKEETKKKHLIISTTVEYNNWFGKLYFLPVRPFHKLIVPTMLKGIIRKLEKENIVRTNHKYARKVKNGK